MGARSTGREAALQMLFSLESGGSIERVISHYWRLTPGDPEGREYADGLARGIANEIDRIDSMIRKASVNWRLERMARVDRNILRMGAWELFHSPDIPRAVIIDEGVELAKKFGTEESSSFVNGVLDRIADDLGRVDKDAKANKGKGSGGQPSRKRGGR
jgi:transcription antitermination protein NusB